MKSPNTKAFQEIIGYDISKDDLIPQENKTVIYGWPTSLDKVNCGENQTRFYKIHIFID